MAHRPLSVAAALPFYYVLPYYAFTNIEAPDEPYLRATAALAFLGWICMLLTALVIYATARRRYQCSSGASLLAALAALLLFNFFDLAGIDALALFLVAILVYFIDRPAVIVPMVLVAAVTNEKVVIIALVLYAGRLLESLVKRRSFSAYAYWPQLLASAFAFLGYIVFRTVMLPRSGYGHQLDPSTWLDTATDTVSLSLSLKGVLTNGVPLASMAVLVVIAYVMAPLLAATNASFRRVDSLVALALWPRPSSSAPSSRSGGWCCTPSRSTWPCLPSASTSLYATATTTPDVSAQPSHLSSVPGRRRGRTHDDQPRRRCARRRG